MGDDGYEFREETAVHRHDLDPIEGPARVRATRPRDDQASLALAARAATAGRTEALGHASVLRLQRTAGNAGIAQALENESESPVHDVIGKGGGMPLDGGLRGPMEQSFGTDFSDVRVHTGGSAASSASAVDAHAYTVGNEIVLGEGVSSGSPAYERTLAHELTHVVQQRSGPVDGTPAGGGVSISSPADRFEQAAETTADRVMAGGPAGDTAGAAGGGSVQRQEDEEEEVQALAIQRQEDEEEPVQTLAIQRQEAEEEQVQALAIQRQEDEEEPVQALAIQRDAETATDAAGWPG